MNVSINVPDGSSGNWRVETFTAEKDEIFETLFFMKCGRRVPEGTYKRLMRGRTVVMSNTPDEIRDFRAFVYQARGNILINGLGLGVLLKALIEKENVTSVAVIEKSEDVIKLVAPTYETNPKVTIINADAFEWKPPKEIHYDSVWHDIWDFITADNVDEMKKLTRKYGRKADFQMCWCRRECEIERRNNKKFR